MIIYFKKINGFFPFIILHTSGPPEIYYSKEPQRPRKHRIWRWTMTTQEAIRLFNNYLQSNHKQRTIDSYDYLLSRFERINAERALDSIRATLRTTGVSP